MAKSINDEKKNITDYIPYFFAGLFVISLIIYIIFLLIPKNNQIETKKLEMMAGETLDISNELDDKTDFDSLIYSVNDEKIATIDKSTGVLEAKSTGKVTVTVKSNKNPLFEKTFVVTVESSQPYVKFNKKSYTCTVGSKVDITMTYGGDVLSVIDYTIPHRRVIFEPDLEKREEQGVLLLNSALTCELGRVGSHTLLWRPFITSFLTNLSKCSSGIVYVLMGSQAQTLEPYINSHFNHVIRIRHPSYYARTKTKMPSDIWSQINNILIGLNGYGIKWYKEY